jgi:hypothetical protein
MTKMNFSPVEEAVLSLIGNRWWTEQELKEELYPEIPPEAIHSAVRYLSRSSLIRQSSNGLLQTELGMMVLAEYRRAQHDKYARGRQLRVV